MRWLWKMALCVVIVLGLLSTSVMAAPVTLSWDAPTTNEDGSPLTDLGGYMVYSRNASGPLGNVDVGNVLTHTTDVGDNTFFTVTAYDTSGNESGPSNEVLFGIAPASPTNLRLGN